MFVISEILLLILLYFFDTIFLRYLTIILCFLYSCFQKKGTFALLMVIFSDYCLLMRTYYCLGIFLFTCVQCYYNYMLEGKIQYFVLLFSVFFPSIFLRAFLYLGISVWNIYKAYQYQHWLFVTLVLLAICDILVAFQYLSHISIFILWYFYLASQIYFVKRISLEQR